jgi:hypothetical protein
MIDDIFVARTTISQKTRLAVTRLQTPAFLRGWSSPHSITLNWITSGILLLGLIQGLLFLWLVPPWQHYDEPTHFEYAWLIANRGRLPQPGDVDYTMRREVAASMVAHRFYEGLPQPNLLTDRDEIWIGVTELVHPPAYYIWASLPVYLARFLPIEMQLYAARLASLALFLMTIGVALRLMRDLAPPGHTLRWAVPLSLTLLAPFADIMTAVNNDVGAVFVMSLFLWIAVRLIRFGLNWRRCVLLIGASALAAATKNTAAVAIVLTPIAVVLSLWRQYRWRWRWLAAGSAAAVVLLPMTTFAWGDAAYWYRWATDSAQVVPTRVAAADAPLGTMSIQVATASGSGHVLINPLLPADVVRLRGKQATVGGWVWASDPITIVQPSLLTSGPGESNERLTHVLVDLTTEPVFVAQTIEIPADAVTAAYVFEAPPSAESAATTVYLDGALIVEGAFHAYQAPTFNDPYGLDGRWGDQAFTNLLRNGSAESAWPRLRPEVDQALVTYIRRSPAQTLSALMDIERIGPFMLTTVASRLFFSFFGTFGWAHINLPAAWQWAFLAIAAVALLGVGKWLLARSRLHTEGSMPALAFLAMAGLLIWGNTVLRALPLLDGNVLLPLARYGFPAMLPTMLILVGGWWAIPLRRWRWTGAAALLSVLLTICLAAYHTLWTFYYVQPMN